MNQNDPIYVGGTVTVGGVSGGTVAVSGGTIGLSGGTAIVGQAGIDQTTPGTTNRVTTGGSFVTVAVEVTKTGAGDTTAYTAKDVFDAATGAGATFANFGRINGGSGVIVRARLATDQKTNVARWRLHLWNTAPSFINDNSPFLYLYANEATYIGYIDFDAMATEDSSNSTAAFTQRVGNLLPFVCAAASRSLIGILEVLDGFTPASAQKVTITLTGSLN